MIGVVSSLVVPIVVVAVVSLPFLWTLVADPITRHLALRYPRRRPTEALLIIIGSLLGTSIITGSLIVGDTFDRSIRAIAYEQLGPIDELVTVSGLDEGVALVSRVGTLDSIPGSDGVLDGVLAITTTQVSVIGDRVQPRAQLLEVDFEAARTFGDDPAIVGLTGTTPAPGEAVITTDLAEKTDVVTGDRITVYVYGQPAELVVVDVVERSGVAGFWTIDSRQQSYNAFVAPGTLAAGLSGVTLPPGVEPPQTHLVFSNVGGVEDGAASTDDAVTILEPVLGDAGSVRTEKRDVLEAASAAADSLAQLYFTMGMFAVAAGILLLVNIFVMLSDERRSQLGMLRALGMRRAAVVMAFATEGWLYAVISSVVGALLGIRLGQVIAWRAGSILNAGEDIYSLRITFAYDPITVVQGFAIGLAIAVATIVLTSVRISRLNVIAAIRDLPVPRRRVARRRLHATASAGLAAIGVAWTVASLVDRQQYGIAIGPMSTAAALGVLAARRWGTRAAVTGSAILVLSWGAVFIPVLGWLDIDGAITLFLVQGLTMCAAAVALLMVHHRALGLGLAERFGGSLAVRVGLAYPVAKAFRTAMSLGMFAIVVLTIVYLSFISLMFGQQTDQITADLSGGFGVIVTSNPSDPVGVDDLLAVESVDRVAPLAYGIADFEFAGSDDPWPVTGFGPEMLVGPPALVDIGDHPSAEAAWQAVLEDPGLLIVDEFFLTTAGPNDVLPSPGDELTISDPVTGASRTVTIAALATNDFIAAGAYYGVDGYQTLFGDRAVASRFYVSAADLDAAAVEIGRSFAANGAEATVVRESVGALLAQNTGFFALMQQFVGVGLLVGVAGLGVVMIRSVRERRRDVGVLRALGLGPRPVTRSFLVEAMFVATEGVLIGVAVAFIGTYGLVLNDRGFMAGFTWAVPWRDIVVVTAVTLGAAAITAIIPARQAGRVRPAQALRIQD